MCVSFLFCKYFYTTCSKVFFYIQMCFFEYLRAHQNIICMCVLNVTCAMHQHQFDKQRYGYTHIHNHSWRQKLSNNASFKTAYIQARKIKNYVNSMETKKSRVQNNDNSSKCRYTLSGFLSCVCCLEESNVVNCEDISSCFRY